MASTQSTPAITEFNGRYRFLSNFLEYPVIWQNEKYDTAEHAYQSAKALRMNDGKYVACAIGPGQAKFRGRRVEMRSDWEEVKDGVMLDIMRAKFSDPKLKKMLLETGDAELIEGNFWQDKYWGVCDGEGLNKLGKILMQVRNELQLLKES